MSSDKKQSVTSRIVFDYLMNHKLKIILALFMMVISAGATGLHAWLVRPALDEVLIKGNKEMLFLIPIAIIIVTIAICTYIAIQKWDITSPLSSNYYFRQNNIFAIMLFLLLQTF